MALTLVESVYGNMNLTNEQRETRAKAWFTFLKGVPDEIGSAAFDQAIRKSHYAPVPADILEEVENMKRSAGGDNIQRYWNIAWKAICGEQTQEAWDGLPEAVREWFGSRQALIRMGQCEDTIESVTRGQFYKTFPDVLEQNKLRNKMPESLKGMLRERLPEERSGVTDKQRLLYENKQNELCDATMRKSTDGEFDARKAKWMSLIRQERAKSRQESIENENTMIHHRKKKNR